ncbi:MAG: hypothetical protein HDR04_20070 [Lachnospiraceae bacterium]|nr:hypothetical protein [Lachnospiraceae bacterium]
MNHPHEKEWKAAIPYAVRAATRNKVILTAKAASDNPYAGKLAYGDDYTITYKIKQTVALTT